MNRTRPTRASGPPTHDIRPLGSNDDIGMPRRFRQLGQLAQALRAFETKKTTMKTSFRIMIAGVIVGAVMVGLISDPSFSTRAVAEPTAMRKVEDPVVPDCLSVIRRTPELARSIGLERMSSAEQSALGELFTTTYLAGYQACKGEVPRAKPIQPSQPVPEVQVEQLQNNTGFTSTVKECSRSIVSLDNGTVVELTGLAPIMVSRFTDCIMYRCNGEQQLWIKVEGSYSCTVIRAPEIMVSTFAVRQASIAEVSSGGEFLKLLSDDVYEVYSLDRIHSMLWLPASSVIIFNDSKMIRKNRGDRVLRVTRVR